MLCSTKTVTPWNLRLGANNLSHVSLSPCTPFKNISPTLLCCHVAFQFAGNEAPVGSGNCGYSSAALGCDGWGTGKQWYGWPWWWHHSRSSNCTWWCHTCQPSWKWSFLSYIRGGSMSSESFHICFQRISSKSFFWVILRLMVCNKVNPLKLEVTDMNNMNLVL